jgi:amino acid permease
MNIKKLIKNYIYPISVFAGGMIGVGFMSLPYIAMKSGIWLTLFYFIVLTALVVSINLIFSEISLKTPDFKRFPGFVGYHLGKYAEIFSIISMISGTMGILLVYLIVGGQFLNSALSPIFGGTILSYTFIYFFVASIIIYFDIKIISKIWIWVLGFLFLSVAFIFLKGFDQIRLENLFDYSKGINYNNLFLPYGPLLFSLWGVGLIPETEEMIIGKKKNLKKIIISSTLIVSLFYLLFVILILSITGSNTTQIALNGLQDLLGGEVVLVSLLIGALATLMAFIAQGSIFKKVLVYDLQIRHWQAFVMTCSVPLILFLLGIKSFIPLLSFIGGILLSIDGILILLMYRKVRKDKISLYSLYVLSSIFLLAIIYQIVYFIK